ncbi:MAG: diacylglycerol kinase [Cocleimonas sp.]|nr:diacylglycerol kinase [Cocleimonas sp.]
MMKNGALYFKLKNALNGIVLTFKTESNFRRHIYSALLTVIFFVFLQPSLVWWGLIFICIGLILAAELANTAIETWLDYRHPKIHPEVGKVKDVMAGMVLSLSVLAVIVGFLAIVDTLT